MSSTPRNEPTSGWLRYRQEVDSRWSSDYYTWVRGSVRAEVWTVMAGAISPAAAALFAYYVWPRNLPISPGEAIGGAAVLGLIGGFVVFLILFLSNSVKSRLLAPYRLWSADRETISDLIAERDRLQAETAQQRARLAELDGEVARLETISRELNQERSKLQAQLDATRQLKLVPEIVEDEYERISVLGLYSKDDPEPIAAVVMGRFWVTIVNNDSRSTTISRLWLCVSDPTTGDEIKPLDVGRQAIEALISLKESPQDIKVEARSCKREELNLASAYPVAVLQWAREGKAPQMITLCAAALGLGTTCCALGDEFFASREEIPTPPEDPAPPTASGQALPSSPEPSGS